MQPLVIMPDAEKAVLDYLKPALASRTEPHAVGVVVANVYKGEVKHVQVRRVGGTKGTPVHDRPRMDFIVRHVNDFDRMGLAQLVRGLVAAGFGPVAEFMGPRQMPDPADSTKTVVMFTVEFVLRGTAG